MNKQFKALAEKIGEISALSQASGIVSWDQETMMPKRAAQNHAEQLSALAGVIHSKFTDKSIGKALKNLNTIPTQLSSDENVCIREWSRDYAKSTRLPQSLVQDIAKTTSLAQDAWIKARKDNNFAAFAPWLEKVVGLKKKYAKCIGFTDHPYDALLDDFEPNMTVKKLDPIIFDLRDKLVPLATNILRSKVKIDSKFLTRTYPEDDQEHFIKSLIPKLGFDTDAGRLDRSAHPFCIGISSPTDVRITSRYNPHWLLQALYGVIHETGHALYDQGFDLKHEGTPLAEAISVGIHESQSRLWENFVGRSLPFTKFILPRLQKAFPKQLTGVDNKKFYRAINKVARTAIRIEADEVTYNLHIILRYELEKSLIAGNIKVADLPRLWNEKMRSYLGVTPSNNAEGVLQDTHWAIGHMGYFPTYLLGNIYAATWWAKISTDIKNLDNLITNGTFTPILEWLRKNIHRHGKRYSANDLGIKITGEEFGADDFIQYLHKKFGKIYDL